MKIYTGSGDGGWTSLQSGERVEKISIRVRAYGEMDEMQSALGMARAMITKDCMANFVYEVQCDLMRAMAEVASIGAPARMTAEDVEEAEAVIDRFCVYLPKGFAFKVPGESFGSAALHMARSVTRRCERTLHELNAAEPLNPHLLAWINRISDLCYVLARIEDEYDGNFNELELG